MFRLQDGIPAGFVDITRVNLATRGAKGAGSQPALALRAAVQLRHATGDLRRIWCSTSPMSAIAALKLPAFRNLNPNTYTFNSQGAPVVGLRELDAPGTARRHSDSGESRHLELQLPAGEARAAVLTGFTMLASYTYGKSLTDRVDHLSTSGVGNGVDVGEFKEPQDPQHRRLEYGPSEFDVTHRFVLSGVWQLPFGRGRDHRQELVARLRTCSWAAGSFRRSFRGRLGCR